MSPMEDSMTDGRWFLFSKDSYEQVRVGDTVTTFRGDTGEVTKLEPPHKPGANGRVYTTYEPNGLYASVYDLEYRFIPAQTAAR